MRTATSYLYEYDTQSRGSKLRREGTNLLHIYFVRIDYCIRTKCRKLHRRTCTTARRGQPRHHHLPANDVISQFDIFLWGKEPPVRPLCFVPSSPRLRGCATCNGCSHCNNVHIYPYIQNDVLWTFTSFTATLQVPVL